MIDNKIKKNDEKLFECFKNISLISHLTPVNIETEKKEFMENKKRNPEFRYKEPKKELLDSEKKLSGLKIPENELKEIFEKRKTELLKQIQIIKNLNNQNNKTKEISSELYGWPDKKTINYAEKLLKKTLQKPETYNVFSEIVLKKLNKRLNQKGLSDWNVAYFKGKITQTTYNKKIFVPENKIFSLLDSRRLPIHEIEVHAIRFQNAYSQPLKIFIYGFPGFLETEEGLAAFIEEKTRNKNKDSFRNYAGRVIAIECLKKEKDFRDCFDYLKEKNFSEQEAWDITFRVYRGEGFVKDHIYLQGYLKIKDYFKKGGSLKKLFIGKIGINDLEIIKKLESENLINKNLIYPNNLKKIIKNKQD